MTFRPPIGFVVEGHGEYECYPSIVNKSIEAQGVNFPRVNAGSCGSVFKNIGEHISDLVSVFCPVNIIITVDLDDCIRQNLVNSCADLVRHFRVESDKWLDTARKEERFPLLPNQISSVVQIRKFETWLISDFVGLEEAGLLKSSAVNMENIEEINNPVKWMKENLEIRGNVKSPANTRTIVSKLNPNRMAENSQSFDKFRRDCRNYYNQWLDTLVE